MTSNSEAKINIHQQIIIQKLLEENNQLKETKNKEEKNSIQFDFQHLHELILKNNTEERAKREEENNLQKSQMGAIIKEIEELKNRLLLLSQVNKEKEDDVPLCKGNTKNIWEAVEKGCLPAVKFYFWENPENIHKKDKKFHHFTPLHLASKNGHLGISKFLISKKVKIDAINSYGETPLMLASLNGHLCIMDLLLDSGVNINHQNKDKWTSLHRAVYKENLDCVKLLFKRGADKKLRNKEYLTPLDLAKRLNKKSIVKYLSTL